MSDAPPVDSTEFRSTMSHYPTGVAVVTAVDDGNPIGFTVGTFSSVSLDPPLVSFSVAKTSASWPMVKRSGAFCVNVLGAGQSEVCWQFARPSDNRFANVGWRQSPGGCAILDCATAWIDCTIEAEHEAGDHWIVIGRVRVLEVSAEVSPLVFYRGKVVTVADDRSAT